MNHEMIDAIKTVSSQVQGRARDLKSVDQARLRSFIGEQIGSLQKLKKADTLLLEKVKKAGGLLCVDGSYNRLGGAAPHYLEIFRGVGICTTKMSELLTRVEVSTPITSNNPESDFSFGDRSKETEARLAQIEIEVAMELVDRFEGYALILDGSLIRFDILCKERWEALKQKCEEKDLPIVGVIEDTKSDGIGRELKRAGLCLYVHYDREILTGKLGLGEVIAVSETFPGKSERGLSSMFARFSSQPFSVGVDMAGYDPKRFLTIASVLYAITPQHGRGVPAILDIVDEKARISDIQMREMLAAHVEKEVLETYFISRRSKRAI